MGAIDSVDFNDAEAGVRCVTEMKLYTFKWRLDFLGLNGREISVMLPADTKYSTEMIRGRIPEMNKYGFFTFPKNDFVDGSDGIPVLSMGKVDIAFTSKTQKDQSDEIITTGRKASVSFSLLPKSVSKESFLNQLKKKDVQILSENENSLLTRVKTAKAYGETVVKTVVSGDVVFQIKVTTFGPRSDVSLYKLFNRICLDPPARITRLFHSQNQFSRRNV